MMLSPDHVVKTLTDLGSKVSPLAKKDIADLQSFCAEKGFKATLEPWDLPYWRRRYKESHIVIDENEMKQLFSLDAVVKVNWCDLISNLTFGT